MRATIAIAAIAIGLSGSAYAKTPPQTRAQQIDIILSDFAFAPQSLHLHHGRAYRLHFVNRGSDSHNFSAPEFFAVAQISPADAGLVTGGKVEVGKGESRTLRLAPAAAGSYHVTCTHLLHASFGMNGSITVD
jgi:plastocyanin